jgi:hypothetical protein
MASFGNRVLGALRLEAQTYEEVEADTGALGQALTVVVLAALSAGIGSSIAAGGQGPGVVSAVLVNLVLWFTWAFLTYLVGTRVLPTPETQADVGQLLRTTGFAAAPGLFGVLGAVPLVGNLVLLLAWLWQLAAMVVAVRQALDYTSTGRAVAVCLIGFVPYVLLLTLFLGLLLALAGSGQPAGAMP